MKKNLVLIISKSVAIVCSVAGLIFAINGQYHESAIAWNGAVIVLWAVLLAT